jgi:hypothetical protein
LFAKKFKEVNPLMKFVHVSKKVEICIKALRKKGKEGVVLANKARCIIENLASGTDKQHIDTMVSLTKYGEKRIKNCRKYDLGCGYRLITLQRGRTIFIPFLGSHDDCQRWLENNSRLKKVKAGKGTIFPIVNNQSRGSDSCGDQPVDPSKEEISINLSEQDMRLVFCGLVEGAKKRFSKEPDNSQSVKS